MKPFSYKLRCSATFWIPAIRRCQMRASPSPKSRIVGIHFFGMITTWISHHSSLLRSMLCRNAKTSSSSYMTSSAFARVPSSRPRNVCSGSGFSHVRCSGPQISSEIQCAMRGRSRKTGRRPLSYRGNLRRMSADRKRKALTPADVLGAEPRWLKEPKDWEKLVADNEVVYEDRHVVVFHDPEDEEHESERIPGEIRLTLLSKKEGVDSLMDLGVADETLSAAILHGIQQAAMRLGLEKK